MGAAVISPDDEADGYFSEFCILEMMFDPRRGPNGARCGNQERAGARQPHGDFGHVLQLRARLQPDEKKAIMPG
jgi:hypothetical protein